MTRPRSIDSVTTPERPRFTSRRYRLAQSTLRRARASKMEAHLESFRQIELSLAELSRRMYYPTDTGPTGTNQIGVSTVGNLQMEFLISAFLRYDAGWLRSVVITVSPTVFAWLGHGEGHHALSHYADGNAAGVARFVQAGRWYAERLYTSFSDSMPLRIPLPKAASSTIRWCFGAKRWAIAVFMTAMASPCYRRQGPIRLSLVVIFSSASLTTNTPVFVAEWVSATPASVTPMYGTLPSLSSKEISDETRDTSKSTRAFALGLSVGCPQESSQSSPPAQDSAEHNETTPTPDESEDGPQAELPSTVTMT